MKTLRAWLWGSLVGALIGYLFAPRHADLLRADLMERQGQQPGATMGGTRGASMPGAARATSTRSSGREAASSTGAAGRA